MGVLVPIVLVPIVNCHELCSVQESEAQTAVAEVVGRIQTRRNRAAEEAPDLGNRSFTSLGRRSW